jgi:hypothetical protein
MASGRMSLVVFWRAAMLRPYVGVVAVKMTALRGRTHERIGDSPRARISGCCPESSIS